MLSISLDLGYKYLKSRKGGIFSFTTLLAIIGLTIGIASLITVTSVMNGFEKQLEDRILGVIPHSLILSEEPFPNYLNLIKEIKKNEDVVDASPYIQIQSLVTSNNGSRGISLVGIQPDQEKSMSILPDYMIVGDMINLNNDNSIIIGSLLAANINAYVGDKINITTSDIKTSIIGSYPLSVNLEVVGIFELKTEIDQYLTLVSHSTAQKLKNINKNETTSIRIKTNDLFNADQISLNVLKRLNNNKLIFSSWKDTHGTLFEAIKFEKLLISLMLFLIIFVASILVLSTIIMTVKSKEREIGILMTIGASSRQIVMIFFYQGIIISLIGIVLGVILGFILTLNLNNLVSSLETLLNRNLLEAYFINYFPYHINTIQIVMICLTSFVISIFSSLIPPLKAIKLNPIEILRHE